MADYGYVFTRCPVCGKTCRVLVTFPAWNKPFNPTIHKCMCGVEIIVSDHHKYDENGYIIDSKSERLTTV